MEMYEFGGDSELRYEKVCNDFLRQLFARWNEERVSHSLTVVLFARTYFPSGAVVQVPSPAHLLSGGDFQGL